MCMFFFWTACFLHLQVHLYIPHWPYSIELFFSPILRVSLVLTLLMYMIFSFFLSLLQSIVLRLQRIAMDAVFWISALPTRLGSLEKGSLQKFVSMHSCLLKILLGKYYFFNITDLGNQVDLLKCLSVPFGVF